MRKREEGMKKIVTWKRRMSRGLPAFFRQFWLHFRKNFRKNLQESEKETSWVNLINGKSHEREGVGGCISYIHIHFNTVITVILQSLMCSIQYKHRATLCCVNEMVHYGSLSNPTLTFTIHQNTLNFRSSVLILHAVLCVCLCVCVCVYLYCVSGYGMG